MDSPGHTVLVVDDDASIRLLCRLNLELDGWHVLEAGTLPLAREQLDAEDIRDVGSDAVIPKPFTIEQLTSTVANLAG